jgi:mono/diheme cytochrome c family protein
MEGMSQDYNTLARRYRVTAKNLALTTLASVVVVLMLGGGRGQYTVAQTRQSQGETKVQREANLIARGKYIVEGLAACGDCHTPRNSSGEIDRTKWLAGAPVFYEPAQRVPGWAISAPRIAGLPPGSDAEVIKLLTTGVWRGGQAPRPPMPRFHMAQEDAEAVVAYLRSL